MTQNKLIMPKQTGQIDAFIASLKLYYESYNRGEEWYSNENFKIKIQEELPYLAEGAQDGPYLVKQSELTRYFGLAYYDYTSHIGRAHITPRGINFYSAYLSNNIDAQIDIIMTSIFEDTFGRNNTAIKSSDSDIDPPKLFLRAIVDLQGITRKGLAYLLYVTHDLRINYQDAIAELSKTDDREREIPIEVANKYSDVKFTVLLTSLGVTTLHDNKYFLSYYVINNYYENIKELSIYNTEPDITLSLSDELTEDDTEQSDSANLKYEDNDNQTKILSAYVYDINSEKFRIQNNREPVPYQRGNTTRYKTNSRIAKTAIDISNYECLCDEQHHTFKSKLGTEYMEAHHLIPMAAQGDFEINIDRVENIVSLCPLCHSAIHLGEDSIRLDLLKKIYDIKKQELESVGLNISFGDLFFKYYK